MSKNKKIKQRAVGVLLILMSIVYAKVCADGVTYEEKDATGAVWYFIVGISMLFSKKCWVD